MSYIEFKEINKSFAARQALCGINLSIEKFQFVTLLGPSGCGKSTLLRCLAGLEQVSSGSIILDGEDVTHHSPQERHVGMVFQQYSLFPNLNVYDNIAFGLKLLKKNKAEINDDVMQMLKTIDLAGREKSYPNQLSGGQQQRVALARSLITHPKVLLLDEPLSAIDAKLRRSLQDRIRNIHEEMGITTIFVTHDQDEAMVMSDMIHLMCEGRIEQSGKPVELYTAPKTRFAAEFIGHYNILSADLFYGITAGAFPGSGDIAIRPETIQISRQYSPSVDDSYHFSGIVEKYISHGNVLRYTLVANGTRIKADVLYRTFHLFDIGQEVFISIEKRNCIQLG